MLHWNEFFVNTIDLNTTYGSTHKAMTGITELCFLDICGYFLFVKQIFWSFLSKVTDPLRDVKRDKNENYEKESSFKKEKKKKILNV